MYPVADDPDDVAGFLYVGAELLTAADLLDEDERLATEDLDAVLLDVVALLPALTLVPMPFRTVDLLEWLLEAVGLMPLFPVCARSPCHLSPLSGITAT